jgi:hypothetical protein
MMAKSDALQRQLDNDEPKCGNCSHWDASAGDHVGACRRARLYLLPAITTDLAVCSKWEAK